MCAVVLADGFAEGGAEGARAQLRKFWDGSPHAGSANPYRRTPMMAFLNAFMPGWTQESYMAPLGRYRQPHCFARTISIRSTSIR